MFLPQKLKCAVALVVLFIILAASPLHAQTGAAHPVVDISENCLLGGSAGGKWVETKDITPQLKGGERYKIYSLTGLVGEATGEKPESFGEPCEDQMSVKMQPEQDVENQYIAVAADWNAQPRAPKVESVNQQVYQQAVRSVLLQHGIRQPRVRLTQVLRVDLEGDGADEVIINATNYAVGMGPNINPQTKAGDYSMILLRKVVGGKAQTILITGEFYKRNIQFGAHNEYSVPAILDLNGDGRMEILVHWRYYEGSGVVAYGITGNKAKELIGCGCGV